LHPLDNPISLSNSTYVWGNSLFVIFWFSKWQGFFEARLFSVT
jgi:hypothetical protein